MNHEQRTDGTCLAEDMFAQYSVPAAPLTTSRRLIKKLRRFEKTMARHKDHPVVRSLRDEFAVINQATLDVEHSLLEGASGPQVSEPFPVLGCQMPEEFLIKRLPASCYRIVPAQPMDTAGVPYVHPNHRKLSPRDLNSPPTLKAARDHLLWKHVPTPLISVFQEKQRALEWAAMLQAKHSEVQFVLVEIDTSSLRSRLVYDAMKLARYVEIPPHRIPYHRDEYLWLGAIDSQYIARKSPISGGAGLTQPTDDAMVKSFNLMNQEARRYASDAGNKRRSPKVSPLNLERSQAVMGFELDSKQSDSIIEEVGPASVRNIVSHQTADGLQRAMGETLGSHIAQPSLKRRLSGPDSSSTQPEAPKKAKAGTVDESELKPGHEVARAGKADVSKLRRDEIPIFAQSARRGKPITFDTSTLGPASKALKEFLERAPQEAIY